MGLKYDGTVNAGAIMQAGVIFVSAVAAVVWTQADIRRLEATQNRVETAIGSELTSIKAAASAHEARIRASELSLAGQQSDLRSIQNGITRIEASIEKLTPKAGTAR